VLRNAHCRIANMSFQQRPLNIAVMKDGKSVVVGEAK
jgi:hypothetical protein